MGKVVVCEATQKTIAVTVRVFVKERFTKVVGVSSLQFKPDFTHAQTGHGNFKMTVFTAIPKQKSWWFWKDRSSILPLQSYTQGTS